MRYRYHIDFQCCQNLKTKRTLKIQFEYTLNFFFISIRTTEEFYINMLCLNYSNGPLNSFLTTNLVEIFF